ncbi:MAG: hypothetical protein QXD59_01375 [Candidatus Caldarchaeum sp.]
MKKIHTLQSLLDEAAEFMPDLSALRPIGERVFGFYIGERYPSVGEEGLQLKGIRHDLPEDRSLITKLFPGEGME